jgi:NAD(P)-dependent dehydrogenase (short-subunit alcohol dehydrogenase family)
MQTLALEGERQDIRVNCLAPTAATAMTEGVLPPDALARLQPASVSPGLIALVGEDAPTRTILLAGAGSFESANITMTRGVFIGGVQGTQDTDVASRCARAWTRSCDREGESVPGTGFEQYRLELAKAGVEVALPG